MFICYHNDMSTRFSQTTNPILKRNELPAKGDGFAYAEGQSAYTQAAGGSAGTQEQFDTITAGGGARLTFADVVVKSTILFIITVVMAFVGWALVPSMPAVLWIGLGGSFALGLINAFKKSVSPVLVLLYAIFAGLMLGAISWAYDQMALAQNYQGLVSQAIIGTLTAFGVMLLLYGTGIVKVNGKFMRIFMAAMISYFVIAMASLVGALFGVGGGWGFYGVGGWGLLLCAAGVLLASFALMLDFEAIKQGIAMGLPERESWRLSFGLLLTLVWLYLEILRFLSIFAGRD
jgi:uncharacterized YccA/Bax inhibitor family protein